MSSSSSLAVAKVIILAPLLVLACIWTELEATGHTPRLLDIDSDMAMSRTEDWEAAMELQSDSQRDETDGDTDKADCVESARPKVY